MSKANVKRTDEGSGADFINSQRARDEAKNEKLKTQLGKNKLDQRDVSNKSAHDDRSDVSRKGTGPGTHNTTGD